MHHIARERSTTHLIALVDELIATYVSWRTACSAVTRSYDLLSTCSGRDREAGFGVYVAALDREERAATTYRSVVEQITALETQLVGRRPPPDLIGLPGSAEVGPWSARSIAHRLRPVKRR
jgi:hypothetical protein